ncbi:MAG: pseudouridine synthase [Ruminococcus sp.]|nr:pseudouridine synthase [Ruminococcus sp.]
MFNKPQGCVTARSDALHRTVMDFFPDELAVQLHPVGRLDKDTCGLLILTNDGELDQKIMQPGKHISKTYFFYALGTMNDEKKQRLENGIQMSGYVTKKARFEFLDEYRIHELKDMMPEDRAERYMKYPDGPAFSAKLTITEGKKHEVRLMLEAVGCRIFYLRRESIGTLMLDKKLAEGEYRPLTDEELAMLRSES